MSLQENVTILERAQDLLEEVDSHPGHLDDLLEAAMKSGDLDEIRHWVSVCEWHLAQVDLYQGHTYVA